MTTTNALGQSAELLAASMFALNGFHVSIPFGEAAPYDLVVDSGHAMYRVQVKRSRLRPDGSVRVKMRTKGGERYAEAADFMCVYCPCVDRMYLIDVTVAPFRDAPTDVSLRVAPPRNNQSAGVNLADDYEFHAVVAQMVERVPGKDEATGSIPVYSTNKLEASSAPSLS